MIQWFSLVIAFAAVLMGPGLAFAQISFPLNGYYVGLGDSVAAGTGALPGTNGYVYRLYQGGVFGRTKETAFSNAALRGARSWDLLDHQVPQVLCAEPAQRPTVVTITAGANDLFRGDFDVVAIAGRVVEAVNLLLNNDLLVPPPVLDPVTGLPCRALEDVTILVSNYYSIPHPDPGIFAFLDGLLRGFDEALSAGLAGLSVPAGSRVAVVDLYTPSLGRQGLVMLERRLGSPGPGPFDFDPHPTNLGHSFIAKEFAKAWRALED
jgi:hypothetical protein